MAENNYNRRPAGSTPIIDLTKETGEGPRDKDVQQQPFLTSTYIYRRHPHTGTTVVGPGPPYNLPAPTQTPRRQFSTISTIRISRKNTGKSDNLAHVNTQVSEEFIDVTTLARKLFQDAFPPTVSTAQLPPGSELSPLDVRCVLCVVRRVTRAVLPCLHLCLCCECGYKLMCSRQACPVCGQRVMYMSAFSRVPRTPLFQQLSIKHK